MRGEVAADVLVGLEAPDDAGVYAWDAERALVTTVDFFTPIVDDPYTFGAVAAANAMSDIYAMGGRPLFALNIIAFPAELDAAILVEILRGGRDKAAEAGVVVIGGHSIDDSEPKYGMAVVGAVHPDRIYRKSAGRPGDRLVLTKALGTGVISTAIKREAAPPEAERAAIDSMVRLNGQALDLARGCDVSAITDVTGFGLLGHLLELARASRVGVRVEASAVPRLPNVLGLAEAGFVPGGTTRNRDFIEAATRWVGELAEAERLILCDAQTSGGLLICVAAAESDDLVNALRREGHTAAAIGTLTADPVGVIEVV